MNNNTRQCNSCGRSFPINTCPAQCNCGASFREYDYTLPACIRNKKPECAKKAIIASTTVEKVSNMEGIRDAFVHVLENNTTYYLDSCGNPIITWAGPIDMPRYDVDNNPFGYKKQLLHTVRTVTNPVTGEDEDDDVVVYYDSRGEAHVLMTEDDITRMFEYIQNEEAQIWAAIDTKQDELTAGSNIIIDKDPDTGVVTISAVGGGTTYTAGDGITISSDEISVDNTIQRKLTAGANINIDANNVISSTGGGETYTAGPGITISATNEIATIMQASDYYDKTEVDNLLSTLESVEMKVVTALPATGEGHIIYLVDNGSGYDQYVYSDNQWHNIGSTSVDLTNYYTKAETNNLLDNKQDKLTAGQGITISGNNTISSDAVAYTAGDNITIESGNIISAVDTKYTAGVDIQITPNNVINYIGSGGTPTKAELLTILGMQELDVIIKDDQGVEQTATVIGAFGTPPTPPTPTGLVMDYDNFSQNTMSWPDVYTCNVYEFVASWGQYTPVPINNYGAEIQLTLTGITLGGAQLGNLTGISTIDGGVLMASTSSTYDSLYGDVYFSVVASNADQDEIMLVLHSSSGMEPTQPLSVDNINITVLDPGHN